MADALFPAPAGPAPLTPKTWAHWLNCNRLPMACPTCRGVAAAIRKEREASRGC